MVQSAERLNHFENELEDRDTFCATMFRSPRRLWLLPDFGMDSRQLAPQASYFSNFGTPPVLDHIGCSDLAQFAARTIDRWQTENEFDSGKYFLGGVGFGGLLAIEMAIELNARSIAPAAVLLIGSSRSKANISRSYRFKLALLSQLPAVLGRGRIAETFRKQSVQESMNQTQSRILQDMARDIDWALFRWQVKAMLGWKRSRKEIEVSGIQIHQLHGRGDHNFRIPSVEDATILIHGQYLINLSLSGEVNRWIESILRDYDLRHSQS